MVRAAVCFVFEHMKVVLSVSKLRVQRLIAEWVARLALPPLSCSQDRSTVSSSQLSI